MKRIIDYRGQIIVLLITALLICTWGFAAVPKALGSGVPAWFTETYGNSFLSQFPGLPIAYWKLVILEVLAFVAALISLVRIEFWTKNYLFLNLALILSLLNFVILGFGLNLAGNNDGVSRIFVYFGVTLVAAIYVELQQRIAK